MVEKILEAAVKAALAAVERTKPSGVYYGVVTSVDPITIDVDQKLILTEEFIVLGRYITEFSVALTIPGEMWRGLRVNDELLLLREQGGQRYCAIDWVNRVEEDTRPAWIKEGEVISVSPLEIKVNDYFTIKEDALILCHSVADHLAFLSFNNSGIKQKVDVYDKAEAEPLPNSPLPGEEPHSPRPDDVPPPIIEKTTDITFQKKLHENTTGYKLPDGSVPPQIEIPEFHEVTLYNLFEIGDRVMLACERSLQKWFVVDFIYQAKSALPEDNYHQRSGYVVSKEFGKWG